MGGEVGCSLRGGGSCIIMGKAWGEVHRGFFFGGGGGGGGRGSFPCAPLGLISVLFEAGLQPLHSPSQFKDVFRHSKACMLFQVMPAF